MRVRSVAILALTCAALSAGEDPLTLTAVEDTTIRPDAAGKPNGWEGKAKDLMIYGPKHDNPNFRALLRFDLKDVPKTPVRAAILKLTFYKCWGANSTRRDILRVQRVARPWNEAGASWGWSLPDDEWLNKGGDLDPAPLAGAYLLDPLHSGEDGTKTVELDVTALVQAWQGGRIPNYGLALLNVDNDSKTTARPFSREADEDAKRPKLILYWAQPPQPDPNAVKPNALKPHGVPVQMRVQFSTPTLNQAHVGQEYKARLFAKGGLAPYTFKANSGLPDGVELTESGELQGKPAKPGRYTISVRIADAQRLSGSGQVELVVAEARPAKVDPLAAGEGKTAPPAAKTGEKTEVVEEE